jgi:hypothetical protein
MPKRGGTTSSPAKTTGADSRLIASVNFTYGGSAFEPEDSITVTYTGNNGYDYALDDWKFDSGKVWTFIPATTSWDDDGRVYQMLSNNRIMSTLFRQLTGGVWEDEQRSDYTYTNGLLATEEYAFHNGTALEPSSRSTNTYNGDMLVTENVQENWNSGAMQWQKTSRMLNHYNTAKQMDTSWQQHWIQMIGQWDDNMRSIYTYTNGKLTEVLQQMMTPGSWENTFRTFYSYDAAGRQTLIENEQWNGSGVGSWEKGYKIEYAYNAAGDMVEEKSSGWNSWAYQYNGKTAYTYNQFHRILTEETQTWNNTSGQWYYATANDYLTRNYYEAYTNSVKAVTSNAARLSVFPMPASEQITISASFSQAQPVSIRIMDMNGRVVKQLADQAGIQYHKQIDVSDIASGSYIVTLSGTMESVVKKIIISR